MRSTMLPAVLATIVLGACGSEDSPRPVTEETVELNEYGVIRVDHDTATDQTQLDAVFCALSRATSAGDIDAQFQSQGDSCTVSNDSADNSNAIAALSCSDALPAQSVSAGSNLLMSSAAGSYADLTRQTTDEVITYTTGSTLPRPPDGLTIDIPGDAFPQFSAVQIPDLEDLQISSPESGEALRSDTPIRWNAASDRTNFRVLLTASDADVTVTCSLTDDGRFNFPSATQAELGDLFAATTVSIRRQNVVSPTRGDSGLVIITSIR
ncbi:MAG: hypothetical protein AAF404_14075 [Pseudomonadota bacterium]